MDISQHAGSKRKPVSEFKNILWGSEWIYHLCDEWKNSRDIFHYCKKVYAIGVDYDKPRNKFFARITPFGYDKQVKLHYLDTDEEVFQEIRD